MKRVSLTNLIIGVHKVVSIIEDSEFREVRSKRSKVGCWGDFLIIWRWDRVFIKKNEFRIGAVESESIGALNK
jgi:hypothetical protein